MQTAVILICLHVLKIRLCRLTLDLYLLYIENAISHGDDFSVSGQMYLDIPIASSLTSISFHKKQWSSISVLCIDQAFLKANTWI